MIDIPDPLPQTPLSVRKRVGRFVWIYLCVPYLSVTLIFALFQRRLLYHPTVAGSLTVSQLRLGDDFAKDVEIESTDGHVLHGWLIRSRLAGVTTGAAPLVIYFPGNAGNRYERIDDLREVAATGFDVLVFDYRGFGDSTGSPSEWALTSDARQVWDFACEDLHYHPRQIVVFGESLGGAVALSLWSAGATEMPRPAAVILNSTFASMPDVVAWHYPWFPFRYLLLDRWRSVDRISHVESPIIVFHGTADEMVPLSEGQKLTSHAAHARLIEVSGGEHNNIPMRQLRGELEGIHAAIHAPGPAVAPPDE